ncbi:hypothetical protein F6X54_03275 [Micromonospora aurantiaca]|uniref:Uncharacterized protein n=1 Tax=Micromonospora aurantiaca (nom. illeg.) TaxID=47850 RepID=A0ABQ6UML3_9ACTN|nr:hypothetical protein [Micromonospora aurantiaca]KAB1118472.1 hypothetical protein F6X54_03275 [Micromonospora aurantiaca]
MTAPPEEMACRTCLVPLNTMGTPPTHVHPVHLATDGHAPAPVPVSQLATVHRTCDFCGDPYPIWTLHGANVTAVAIGSTATLVQNFGETWAACATCQTHIDDGRPDLVVDRAVQALDVGTKPEVRGRIQELHLAFLDARLPGRTLLTTTAWPAASIAAKDLPKVRDRLTHLYRGNDDVPAALGLTGARGQIADGLDQSRLYWIDDDFTDLAEHAATQLTALTIGHDLGPPANVLITWSRPVTQHQIIAASWTLANDGWQVVLYRAIGAGLEGKPLQRLREQVGWLVPMTAAHLTEQHLIDADHPAAALFATWLLIAQKAAEVDVARVDKTIAKAYARTKRDQPEVRIVRIRGRRSPSDAAETTPGEQGRLQSSRFWVSGHWRNQAHGPGRSLRRPVYINPFLKGPAESPVKTSTTVRMLSSHKPQGEEPTPRPG